MNALPFVNRALRASNQSNPVYNAPARKAVQT